MSITRSLSPRKIGVAILVIVGAIALGTAAGVGITLVAFQISRMNEKL